MLERRHTRAAARVAAGVAALLALFIAADMVIMHAEQPHLEYFWNLSATPRERKPLLHRMLDEDGENDKQDEEAEENGNGDDNNGSQDQGPGNDDWFDDYIQDGRY